MKSCISRELEKRFEELFDGKDDNPLYGELVNELSPEDAERFYLESEFAWPYMLEGIHGEPLYEIIDRELYGIE